MREALESGFEQWCESVDVEGIHDLAGLLVAGVRSLVATGEILLHMVTTPRGELQLALLSPGAARSGAHARGRKSATHHRGRGI